MAAIGTTEADRIYAYAATLGITEDQVDAQAGNSLRYCSRTVASRIEGWLGERTARQAQAKWNDEAACQSYSQARGETPGDVALRIGRSYGIEGQIWDNA